MSAHLYWRLNVSANNGASQLALGELALYVAGGASSAATGGTASASTTNGSQTASLAFDGNTATYWQATVATGQLQYQFASAVDITSYMISEGTGVGASSMPKAWTLEYSDNGSTWTVADTVTNQTRWDNYQTNVYTTGQNAGSTANSHKLVEASPAVQVAITWPPVQVNVVGKAPSPGPKKVSGTVTVLGAAGVGLLVRAYAKATGELVGQATTDSGGAYSINCGQNWADVYVLAFDPATYQALVYDQITPA